MEDKILKKIKEIRSLISQLMGTSDLPAKERFSKEAITKARAEFKQLSVERGEWIHEDSIKSIIKKAPHNPGKFIIEKFGFTNYFVRGKSLYFNKGDLIALKDELKKRNINLGRYIELVEDQGKFRKNLESIKNLKGGKKRQRFKIPEELRDIDTFPYNHPSREIVKKHIEALFEEFNTQKLAEYIDVYQNSHAMYKYIYYFDRYVDPEIKRRCEKWCFEFNYANNAISAINKIKSETIYGNILS